METRRLAAIMFTDIVGYTRLMGSDEEKALKILENNRDLHRDLLILYNGQKLKEIGDGMLCSFDSASKAVKCAIELIRKSNEYKNLKLRIGIHIGEVVFSDNDVFGDGVNIASRIEAMAIPDSVLISEKVYDEIRNKHNIKVKHVGTFNLKNDTKSREIYAVANTKLKIPGSKDLHNIIEDKPELQKNSLSSSDQSSHSISIWRRRLSSPRVGLTVLFSLMALAFGSLLFINLKNNPKIQWARQEALPKIQRYLDEGDFNEAFNLALETEKYIPNDSMLLRMWPRMSGKINLNTDPSGATIYYKSITADTSEYLLLGQSPLEQHRAYRDYSIYKIEKPGYRTREFLSSVYELRNATIKLLKSDSLPGHSVFVPFYGWQYRPFGTLGLMKFHELPALKDFLMDKYEVTNKEFKVFVDSGGYHQQEYWDYPIKQYGQILNWADAMKLFIDQTGQPGPSSWEVSDYPEGKGDHPVSGVSWYEAMAYAKFAGKSLPTVYHWMYASTPLLSDYISPNSNFSNTRLVSVGSYGGIGLFGTYDMAGNVREWCQNIQSENGNAFILGGGWSDNPYNYNMTYTQDPSDRSEINGFRCIQYIQTPDNIEAISGDLPINFRDYSREKPVDDQTFDIFLRQFKYDKTDLNEQIEYFAKESTNITYERITIDAAYSNERLPMYLFLPKNGTPPYQTVIHFPSTYPFSLSDSKEFMDGFAENYLNKNGRAVLFPVYKLAFERSDKSFFNLLSNIESIKYKDLLIMWVKDIGRCIDYLEMREDIDSEKIAFGGVSLGAATGAIVPAVEKRIKTAVLVVAGLWHSNPLPEADQINYLPRITIPVLMINGKYDHIFPMESSQKPMFELLGTLPENKELFIYEHGHHIPQNIIIRETLNWLDVYLGPVDPGI